MKRDFAFLSFFVFSAWKSLVRHCLKTWTDQGLGRDATRDALKKTTQNQVIPLIPLAICLFSPAHPLYIRAVIRNGNSRTGDLLCAKACNLSLSHVPIFVVRPTPKGRTTIIGESSMHIQATLYCFGFFQPGTSISKGGPHTPDH